MMDDDVVGHTIENNVGQRIETLEQWRRLAPPTSPAHWREYRSAFELALGWTDGDAARDLHRLLSCRTEFAGLRLDRAIAERRTYFDDIPGGPRVHDLLVLATTVAGPIVVGIEAKADESFDRDLADYVAAARRREPSTRAPERLDRLTRAFFGTTLAQDATLAAQRYQLLSALAGTLAEAQRNRAVAAVLLVHEFSTPATDAGKQRRNAADLEAFVRRLGDTARVRSSGGDWLAGPLSARPTAPRSYRLPVFVGKLHTHVQPRATASGVTSAPEVRHRPAAAWRDGAPPPAPPASHRVKLPIPSGATVIKINVHPPQCPCGCISRGDIPFMLNRPGDGLRPVKKHSVDEAVRLARDWVTEARRRGSANTRSRISAFELRSGMATMTLTAETSGPAPRFIARNWTAVEEHVGERLDVAVAILRQWCEAASRPRR